MGLPCCQAADLPVSKLLMKWAVAQLVFDHVVLLTVQQGAQNLAGEGTSNSSVLRGQRKWLLTQVVRAAGIHGETRNS